MIEHLSYSSISSYLLCPRAWKFRYIEKPETSTSPALVFGSAFHGVIEKRIGGDNRELIVIWGESWPEQLENPRNFNIDWQEESQESLDHLGKAMLQNKQVADQIDAIKPLFLNEKPVIEKYIKLQIPGMDVPVIGYIDVITDDGIPCDLKTAGRKWADGKAEEETQPLFYLAALNQEGYSLNPENRFRHYVFTKTKTPAVQVIETRRTMHEVFMMFEQIAEVWRGIQSNVFPTNWNTWKCSPKYCEYWRMCRGKE